MSILYMILMIVVLAGAISIHELGHYIYLKKANVHVHEFSIGFGPVLWKTKRNETQISVRAIPLGGFVLPATKAKTKFYKDLPEDGVIKKEGTNPNYPDQKFVKKNGKMMIMIEKAEYEVEGKNVEDATNGQKLKYILAGVSFNLISALIVFTIAFMAYFHKDVFASPANFFKSFLIIGDMTLNGFGILIRFFAGLFVGQGTDQIQSVVGIVGSSESIFTSGPGGAGGVAFMVAGIYFSISLNLVILNLLPFPPLDGYKIYTTIYTMITKKKVNPDFEEKVTNAAVTILMLLFGFLIVRDVLNMF